MSVMLKTFRIVGLKLMTPGYVYLFILIFIFNYQILILMSPISFIQVKEVDLQSVLMKGAYLLLYARYF